MNSVCHEMHTEPHSQSQVDAYNMQPLYSEPVSVLAQHHAVAQRQQPNSQSDPVLGRMMSMLEQVLEKVQQDNSRAPHNGRLAQNSGDMACKVCSSKNHSTKSHCISERLCFKCFSPEHNRRACPNGQPQLGPVQGNGQTHA